MKKLLLFVIPILIFMLYPCTSDAGYVYNGNEYQYCFENFGNSSYKQLAYFNVADGWYPFLCGSSPSNPSKVFSYKDCQYVILTNGSSIIDPYNSSQFDSKCSGVFIEDSSVSYSIRFESMLHDIYNLSFVSNFPVFESHNAAMKYYSTGDTTGSYYIPEPPAPEFDPFSSEYDDSVPVPQVITKFNVIAGVTTPIISFTNGSTDYNVVIYGRWNSINDVTLRKEKLHWVYDYTSLLHGDLECWVSDEDNRSSRDNFDFFSDSHFTDTYQAFLLKYPLSERYITNDPTLFEKLTGYNEALFNFTDLYMNMPNNAYSKPDFFFRYYYRDEEQNIHYSRWAHLTFPLVPPGENGFESTTDQLWKGNLDYQVSNKPLTSEEVLDEKTYFDSDQTKYNILNNQQSYDLDQIDWTMSLDNLQSLTSVFGQMPAFVATVFSCYPSWMVQMIGATITILCALAIYHGIRG